MIIPIFRPLQSVALGSLMRHGLHRVTGLSLLPVDANLFIDGPSLSGMSKKNSSHRVV